jgi:uncharacterized protein (TIGR02284 family)
MPDQMLSDKSVVEALQDLAAVCRDALKGYRDAALRAADHEFRDMLDQLARQSEATADRLDQLIREQGGQVGARAASVGDFLQRMFTSLSTALAGHDRAALLGELARVESYAEAAFDRVKRLDLPGRARELVDDMHDKVKQSRDRLRRLAATEGGWNGAAGRGLAAGKRSLETVGSYVGDNPLTGSVIALGLGFVLGAFVMAMARPGRGNAGGRSYERGDGPRGSIGTYDPTGRAYGDQDVAAG